MTDRDPKYVVGEMQRVLEGQKVGKVMQLGIHVGPLGKREKRVREDMRAQQRGVRDGADTPGKRGKRVRAAL